MTTYVGAKFPFEFTPQIYRFLEELVEIAEKTYGDEINLKNYEANEPKSPELELNNGEFWSYLESIGAVKMSHEKGWDGAKVGATIEGEVVEKAGTKTFYFSRKYLRILDEKKIKAVLKNRESGAVIRPQTLELLAKDIAEQKTGPKLINLLKDCGVPSKMIIYPDTKWRMLFKAFRILSTSSSEKANRILYKIIEAVVHPLFFEGDEEKASEKTVKYNKWLKYDHIAIDEGKIYIGPTEEEWEAGIDDWVSSDGEVFETKSQTIFPNYVAEIWVLWSQIIVLVESYPNYSLDRKVLEKLYLEVIEKVEDLIEGRKIGELPKTYKRPFTSLSTAEVEARAKKTGSPLELISAFLLDITALNPHPQEIAKKMEKHAELIERIAKATKAISGDEINLLNISYEQALFLLKIVVGHIFGILDASSTGYINTADEKLNARYIVLSDHLNGILSRDDFSEIKKNAPEHLPENLYEMIDEMDIWWSECGGKSGMIAFIGSIETAWVRAGQQTFPVPPWLISFLNDTDKVITEHRQYKAKQWERMTRNIDDELKKNGGPFGDKKEKVEPTQKVVHEHTHRFENNIQEKDIVLNHKYESGKPSTLYITKKDDDFFYKGLPILASKKKTDYYKVLCALYAKLPEGGAISYKDLIAEIKSRMPKQANKTNDEIQKFIQRNLTDRNNGFMRYAKIPETEDNGKPLISVERGTGLIFNNKTG